MKYKCSLEQTIRKIQTIEIDACSQKRAEEIFEDILEGKDHRYRHFRESPDNSDFDSTILDEIKKVEYVRGDELPEGVFEFEGAKFEPIRKITFKERVKLTASSDPYASGLLDSRGCKSCRWEAQRWLNEFYDAAIGAKASNKSINIFRCLDDGKLYLPMKYGILHWTGKEEYEPDYEDLVDKLSGSYEKYSDSLFAHTHGYRASSNDKFLRIKISFSEDSWFPSFGCDIVGGPFDYNSCVTRIAEALKSHVEAFNLNLMPQDCPVKAVKLIVKAD